MWLPTVQAQVYSPSLPAVLVTMRAFLLLGGLTLLQAAPQLSDSYGPPLAPPVRVETLEKQCRLEKSKEFIPGKCFEGKPECQKGNCKPGPPVS